MSDELEVLDRLLRKERLTKESRDALGQVLSGGIINPSCATGLFNSIMLRLDLKEDARQQTGCTDGTSLWYSPEFVAGLTQGQCEWFLAHEALHVGLAHPARMAYFEDQEVANVAADLVVNQILTEAGLTEPPPGVLFPGRGEHADIPPGLDLDTTYDKLLAKKRQQQPQPGEGEEEDDDGDEEEDEGDGGGQEPAPDEPGEKEVDDGGGPGDDRDGGREGGGPPCPDPGGCGGVVAPGDGSPAAAASQEAEAAIMMAEAEAIARSIGTLPAALEKLLSARKKKPQDWRARMRDWLCRRSNDRLGWDKPRAWGISRGIYLPGKSGKTLGKIIVAVDTSGSCWGPPLESFAGELQSVAEQFPKSRLILLYCDCRINKVTEYDPEEGVPLVLECVGGGGTSHVPVFEWVEENHPDCDGLICFTDMATSFPEKKYPWDTLWATAPGYEATPPFGEVIKLEAG